MKKGDREKLVMDKLTAQKKLDITEMVEYLGVSESTVRRLFIKLEQTGKAIRTHGSIMLNGNAAEYSFESLIHENFSQKRAIGVRACAEIVDNDIVYLDCGTTALALCIELAGQIRDGQKTNVQVFTNSLANMDVLAPVTTVNLIGGRYRPGRKDFAGYLSEKVLKSINFDKSFLGADGISLDSGFSATDLDTASLNQIIVKNSRVKYVLCDCSKFGRNSLISYAPLSGVDVVITDHGLDPAAVGMFSAGGLRILISGPQEVDA